MILSLLLNLLKHESSQSSILVLKVPQVDRQHRIVMKVQKVNIVNFSTKLSPNAGLAFCRHLNASSILLSSINVKGMNKATLPNMAIVNAISTKNASCRIQWIGLS